MNIRRFEKLLRTANPRFRIRERYNSPIGGVFIGDKDFKVTITRGHVPLNTFRYFYMADDAKKEKIVKRGRAEILRMLRSRRMLSRLDSVRIKYGISSS